VISSLFIVAFVLADGLVRGNSLAWAAPWRAGMLAVLIVSGLIVLRARGHRLDIATMGIVGVIGAMLVSDSFYHIGGLGLSAMVLYAGAFAWQRIVKRNLQNDLSRAGVILAALVLFVVIGWWAGQFPAVPSGAWNRNVIAGTLAVLMASVPTGGRLPTAAMGIIAIAIVATGSRGGILAGAAALIVNHWSHVKRFWIPLSIVSPAAIAGLYLHNPSSALERQLIIRNALEQVTTVPLFGVGPGQLLVTSPWVETPYYHAHNAVVSFVSQVGLAGGGILGVALGVARREIGHGWQRWQLATLAAVAVHSLVDEPLTWWPTGLIVALVLGSRAALP
jgi:hypothetical protein